MPEQSEPYVITFDLDASELRRLDEAGVDEVEVDLQRGDLQRDEAKVDEVEVDLRRGAT